MDHRRRGVRRCPLANAGPNSSTCRKGSHSGLASQTRGLLNGGAPRYAKGKASAKAKAKAKAKAAKNAAIDAKIKAKTGGAPKRGRRSRRGAISAGRRHR